MMDALTIVLLIACAVSVYITLDTRARLNLLQQQQDRDGHYFEWWLRSMEERKADRESVYDDAEE